MAYSYIYFILFSIRSLKVIKIKCAKDFYTISYELHAFVIIRGVVDVLVLAQAVEAEVLRQLLELRLGVFAAHELAYSTNLLWQVLGGGLYMII